MKYDKRFHTLAVLTVACLIWCVPSFGAHDPDKIDRVLQQSLEDLGHTVTFMRSGEAGDEFFTVTAYDPNLTGLQLQATGYASQKAKEALRQVGELFTKGAEAQYGSLAPGTSSTFEIDGVKVKRVSYAAKEYESVVANVSMPKMANLYVDVNPLLTIAVTVQGDRDPRPYMEALIRNLKKEGMLGPVEEGVEFTIQVRKDGWMPLDRPVATGSISPSSITVTGTVIDLETNPVPAATLHIPSLNLTTESDMNGKFRLHAATQGKEPFSKDLTLVLQQPTSGTTVMITGVTSIALPVPGTPKLKLTAVDKDAKPIPKAKVELKWTVPKFVKTPMTSAMTNDKGELDIPLDIQKPAGITDLSIDPSALNIKVEATVTPKDGGASGQGIFTAPLNLALIVGETVGPDMKPRAETEPPVVSGVSQAMVLDRWKDSTGTFRALVHPLHPVTLKPMDNWMLFWGEKDRLPLNLPLDESPVPGKILDVGTVEVLTPEEHIKRLTDVLAEFCADMPLTTKAQSDLQKAIKRLVFQPGGSSDVPVYQDNYTNSSGVVYTPGDAKEYWGKNLLVGDDAAYQIIPHELGHFVHHHLVERHAFIHMCYNKLSTGDHATWKIPSSFAMKAKYMSFSENTADFFALVFRVYWLDKHPEIAESRYFKRLGYMPEFENDEKAMAVVGSGTAGYLVEGVQTRFLRAFYGNAVTTRPAPVYADYLRNMVMHMDPKYYMPDSIVKRPARTMIQWVRVKQHVPTRFGPSDVTALAARYRMLPETDPVPTATPEYGKKDARITIDGTPEDFSAFPVVTIPFGKPVEVTAGMVNIDVSDKTTTRTLVVKAPAKITLVSRTKVEVHKGLVGADFPVELVTPGGTVKPTGTVVQVHVDDMGNTKIDTLHGTVEVTSTDGTVKTLNIGESMELAANGVMSAVSTCDPQQLMDQLIPAVESPFTDPPAGISLDWTGLRDKIRTLPWWAVLAAGILFFVLLGTMLFLLRRLLAALIAGPLMTIGLVAVGRLLINNPVVENMTFGEFLLSPWTAWQTGHEWLPAAAWAIGGLVAGMIIGGFIRGFLTGCIMPVIPWLIYHYDLAVPASWDWNGISDSLLQLIKVSPGDLLALLAVTGFCALVGGMLLPRKKRAPLQAGGSRPSRRRMINRDNDGDWHDHHHHDDNDFDGDDGDD